MIVVHRLPLDEFLSLLSIAETVAIQTFRAEHVAELSMILLSHGIQAEYSMAGSAAPPANI